MLSAEQKTCKIKTTAWSPTYSKAIKDKAFWKIILSLRRNYIKPHDKFLQWAASRNIMDFAGLDTHTIPEYKNCARHNWLLGR
jgi:hypothetical protein